ncbi:PLC-like phosphodiesterase [Pisolithus sp. B1]|nr:PLC-like phosphodiesterase [Pisolithus sp. B1]
MERHEQQRPGPSPKQMLRRAAELLTTQGKPLVAVQDVLKPQHDTTPSDSSQSGSTDSGIRRSLSSRLSKVRAGPVVRAISLRSPPNNGQIRKRHGRAMSESQVRSPYNANIYSLAEHVEPTQTSSPNPLEDPTNHRTLIHQPSSPQISGKPSMADVPVPALLQHGVPMIKVSPRSQKRYTFRLDADQGQIIWESKKLRIIPIENIKELRSGSDATYYRQLYQLAHEYEDRWITIVYILDGQYKTLHLIASSKESFQLWDITLRKLYAIRQELMTGPGNEEMRHAMWVRQCWKSSEHQNDQKLSFDEVERLCRRLNVNASQDGLVRLFKQADSQRSGFLDFTDFRKFVQLLKARPELDLLYKKLSSENGGKFTFTIFEAFMRNYQKSSLSQEELRTVFLRYARKSGAKVATTPGSPSSHLNGCDDVTMSLDAFTAFLLSSDNSAFTDQHGRIHQDMTQPLCHYFISSSHNTYLVGHQLVGDSTIEGYIRALLQGCRSVELDIYDGDHEPMVFHGKTLTSKVRVREVCEAISKYAFVTSPYPIIISAEVHCSVAQQDMLVAIMHEVFGEALVSAPVGEHPKIDKLPSPEELRGKVLLKAKNLYVSEQEQIRTKEVVVDTESSSTDTSTSDLDIANEVREELRRAKTQNIEAIKELKEEFRKARNVFNRVRGHHQVPEKSVTTALVGAATATSTAIAEQPVKSEKQETKVKMSAALVALLVYTVGVKCRGINKKERYAPEHVFSLSETTASKIMKQGMVDLIKHTKDHLVRIYPKGLRLSSTNYLPHRYWAAGAQLVALNWQTFDLGYMINHAMFQRNGRAGYLLKPEALRLPDKGTLARRTLHHLDVTIISAQQLRRPKDSTGHEIIDRNIVDPYVEVSIYTPDWTHFSSSSPSSGSSSPPTPSGSNGSSTTRAITARTSSVKNNGFNPVWQESLRLTFECAANLLDLVFVRFTVLRDGENDGEPIAVYCVNLASLAMGKCLRSTIYLLSPYATRLLNFLVLLLTGYRHLPLHDSQLCQYLFSTLFVKCSLQDD